MTINDAELELRSVAPEFPLVYDAKAVPADDARPTSVRYVNYHQGIIENQQEKIDEVSRQQKAFE